MMLPTFRSGARAIGLSGWLAALHSDKYNSLKTLDTSQSGTPTGLYSSGSSIWGNGTQSHCLSMPMAPKSRVGFSEIPGLAHAHMAQPSYPNHQPFNYPPSTMSGTQQQHTTNQSEGNNNVGLGSPIDELSALTLDPLGISADQPRLDPSVDSIMLEAMMSSKQQEAELQQREFQVVNPSTAQRHAQCSAPSECHCGSQYCYHHQDMLPHVSYGPIQGQEAIPQETFSAQHLVKSAIKDPGKTLVHMGTVGFSNLADAIQLHIYTVGPVPDMNLFHLFRKVATQEQVDMALGVLMDDRGVRVAQGLNEPYDEVTSAAVFNALNRVGGDEFVVAAAEKYSALGLTLSRSNMYHLMKQYSVQGKVVLVERLFRALDAAGKSWNSNCIVIMMLAYFNQGKFEDANVLRHELRARGIKISERIESRLDKLLSGEESWLWEDKIWARPQRQEPPAARGLSLLARGQSIGSSNGILVRPHYVGVTQPHMLQYQHRRAYHVSKPAESWVDVEEELEPEKKPPAKVEECSLSEAILEPRQNLTQLRLAGFDELCSALEEMVDTQGPVEHVCVSFLFRKVGTRQEVEKAMKLLEKDREARKRAGLTVEYNETTCSRIFNALFRADAADLALEYAATAKESGLLLSGKALHELLKNFATRNDIQTVRHIWKLVKENGKPSSRIVYSIFRTYFDNNLMEDAAEFRKEIEEMGINLSASATRNIEEVLSGSKHWVKDPKDL